jgi:hypothetical protein
LESLNVGRHNIYAWRQSADPVSASLLHPTMHFSAMPMAPDTIFGSGLWRGEQKRKQSEIRWHDKQDIDVRRSNQLES